MTADDRPLDPAKVDRLLHRAAREVEEGLLPAVQLAVAHRGRIVVERTFGAPEDSRFVAFSATKALTAAAVWRLLDQGQLALDAPVARYLPSFATNGKDAVLVEHLLTHVGGFPYAPLGPPRWKTRESRLEAFSRWRLNTEPGSGFTYHPTAGHWVLGELIAEVTGMDHRDAIEELVTAPLGLPRVLGIGSEDREGINEVVGVGQNPTPEEMEEAYGFKVDLAQLIPPDVALGALLSLNDPEAQEIGIPGAGGILQARHLALFYQDLLDPPEGLWSPEILRAGTAEVRSDLPDWTGMPSHRTLGLVLAGDDGFAAQRGFGHTASAGAFGHRGAGGQLAFADPASGLSVGYLTSGLDQHLIRQARRDSAIASLATDLFVD